MLYIIDSHYPRPKHNKYYEYTLDDAKDDAKQITEYIGNANGVIK